VTVADLYCSRSDVAKRLPPGGLPSAMGLVASSLSGTDVITYDGHGFETDDPVTVRAVEGGSLSSPLAAGTTYYVIRLSNSTFKLAATAGGSAIDLTSDASEMVVLRDPAFDDIIEFYSRWVDGFFPAHLVPFQVPIPVLVKGIVADLAAKRLLNIAGQDSAILNTAELAAKAQLERYFSNGMPVRDEKATSSANAAVSSTVASAGDPRGWGSGVLP
jgi:hypothetical protein